MSTTTEAMTDDELLFRISGACDCLRRVEHGFWEYFDSINRQWTACRNNDPLNDLNAMHEAESAFPHPSDFYRFNLAEICGGEDRIYRASARQRAEAFLATIA